MRRLLILGLFAAVGLLLLRRVLPTLRERMEARCEGMLEQMPDTFPPKRAMNGIEEIRGNTERILALLTAERVGPEFGEASPAGTVHDVA